MELMHFVTPDLEIEEYAKIKGLIISTEVLRKELEFDPNSKPGDFDILVIPYSETGVHIERTAAIEVKVVRPTRAKPERNANSLGVTQLKGMIEDGFPFAGLIHVCIPEALPKEEMMDIKFCTLPAGDNTGPIPEGKTIDDFSVKVKMDQFPYVSVKKQIRRLLVYDIPKYAGLYVMGLAKNSNGDILSEHIHGPERHYFTGYLNPKRKIETQMKIGKFLRDNPDRFITRKVRD